MAKYNIGDKVKVRENINEIDGARGIPPMAKFAGKEVTISKVDVIPSMLINTYEIAEDDSFMKYVWSDIMFEDIASTAPKKNPMPELTNGIFGKNDDGELFVIVNDLIIYKKGTWDWVKDITDGIVTVDALYKSNCFNQIEQGKAEVIWERDTTEIPDEKVDYKAFDDFIEFLEFLKSLDEDESKDDEK